jgi:hypothetical protein
MRHFSLRGLWFVLRYTFRHVNVFCDLYTRLYRFRSLSEPLSPGNHFSPCRPARPLPETASTTNFETDNSRSRNQQVSEIPFGFRLNYDSSQFGSQTLDQRSSFQSKSPGIEMKRKQHKVCSPLEGKIQIVQTPTPTALPLPVPACFGV